MAIKLSKWNGPVGVIAPAAGTIGGGAATGSATATDAAGGGAGTIGITAAGGAMSEAAGGSAGSVSPEVAGMTASVEEDPEEATRAAATRLVLRPSLAVTVGSALKTGSRRRWCRRTEALTEPGARWEVEEGGKRRVNRPGAGGARSRSGHGAGRGSPRI